MTHRGPRTFHEYDEELGPVLTKIEAEAETSEALCHLTDRTVDILRDAYVDGPHLTIDFADYDRSLAFICPASNVQPQMTAGQDGFRCMSSQHVFGL